MNSNSYKISGMVTLYFSGYGLEGDLRMLVHAVPCLSESLDKINSVVDLEYLHHKVHYKTERQN